jgi:hypothetical protein
MAEKKEIHVLETYEKARTIRKDFNLAKTEEQVRRIKWTINLLGMGNTRIDDACNILSRLPHQYAILSSMYEAEPWLGDAEHLPPRATLDSAMDRLGGLIQKEYKESRIFRNRVSQRITNSEYRGLKDMIFKSE